MWDCEAEQVDCAAQVDGEGAVEEGHVHVFQVRVRGIWGLSREDEGGGADAGAGYDAGDGGTCGLRPLDGGCEGGLEGGGGGDVGSGEEGARTFGEERRGGGGRGLRSRIETLAPAERRVRAVARPRPEEPPEMRNVRAFICIVSLRG